ncbi:MAG: PEPxxWA-CTERM sorting domain-containing protein [Rhizobacter sp.]
MSTLKRFAAQAAALLAFTALSLVAHATTTALSNPGQWYEFDVADGLSQSQGTEWIDLDGAPLSFTFTIAAPVQLRVVDAGYAGDTFNISLNGASYTTSAVAPGVYPNAPGLTDFDAAWADASFSRGTWLLSAPGTYTLTGSLAQSVTDANGPLNATLGAVMLAPVPEPTTWALLIAGLAVLGFAARRRT